MKRCGAAVGRRIYLETFGCQMNVLDSQLVQGQLRALGYRFVDSWREADVVLYNTCSVRARAEQKVYSRVGEVGQHKQKRNDVILGVVGCMAEREGTELVRRYPQIDLLCGPGELDKLPLLIDNAVKTGSVTRRSGAECQTALQGNVHRRSATLGAAEDQLELLDLSRSFSPDDFEGCAYVRITRGCNKFCTYCVVPQTRGAEVHRPPHTIVEECRRLVDAGVVQITLLGQTVNHYEYDSGAAVAVRGVLQPQVGRAVRQSAAAGAAPAVRTASRVTTFADLLALIHDQVRGLQRLRFVTSFPRDFGDDILHVMRDCRRICRYLHLPVQSGSDRVLRLMNRDYTVGSYLELLDRVRQTLPDCQVATDIICGFPSETEQDHQATAQLLGAARCKNAFIFKYSPRPGTTAFDRHSDDVPPPTKARRNNELLAVQMRISAEVHATLVGRTVSVFVESVSARARKSHNTADPSVTVGWDRPESVTQLCGRTDTDLIVMFEADPSLVGRIVKVKIESSAPLVLFGHMTGEPASGRQEKECRVSGVECLD